MITQTAMEKALETSVANELAIAHRFRFAADILEGMTDGIDGDRLGALVRWALKGEVAPAYEPTEEDPAEFAHTDGGDLWNNAVAAYRGLWNHINGADSWNANPWVWAVSFEVVR